MNKTLKRVLIGLGVLALVIFVGFQFMLSNTKKASPEDLVEYTDGTHKLEVFYCQPSKKGREIFGGLVPYGKVWRTGANEASTFKTSHAMTIGDQTLPAGKYTLWTIPNPEQWTVIFNKKMYGWGVNFSEEALREPEFDEVTVDIPVKRTDTITEKFTIKIDESPSPEMQMNWDQTEIRVPLTWK